MVCENYTLEGWNVSSELRIVSEMFHGNMCWTHRMSMESSISSTPAFGSFANTGGTETVRVAFVVINSPSARAFPLSLCLLFLNDDPFCSEDPSITEKR